MLKVKGRHANSKLLPPFIGNGDVAIGMKYSLTGLKTIYYNQSFGENTYIARGVTIAKVEGCKIESAVTTFSSEVFCRET